MKKLAVILAVILVLSTGIPMEAFGAAMEKGDAVTISEGKELVGNDGKPYYLASGYYTARFSNSKGTGFDYRVCLALSSKNVLTINNGKSKYQGYCIEHGAWMNPGSTKYTGNVTELKSLYWLKPYSSSTIDWIELALLFGKQPGMRESDVPVKGCNLDDWYFATQNIIWEFQQGLRTSATTIRSNPKTQSANWYAKTMVGRPAYKMYQWMLEQMGKYDKAPSFMSKNKDKPTTIKLSANEDGTWSGVFNDVKNLNQDIKSMNSHIEIQRTGNQYLITSDINPISLGVIKCVKEVKGIKATQPLLAFTTGQSSTISNHLQSVVWGARDPMEMYFKVGEGKKPDNPDEAPILPKFHLDVSKVDKNFGFDGEQGTGMGDAALDALIGISVTTDGGTTEESVSLDEFGQGEGFDFMPWTDVADLERTENKREEHVYVNYTGTAKVTTNEEVVPEGRFSEVESGTGNGERIHLITYNAESVDGGPFTYNINVDGTNYTEINEAVPLPLKADQYVNDLFRGRLQIIKTKTDLNPFTDNSKGVIGTEGTYSTKSKWTVKLISDGFESNPYIKVVALKEGEKGFDSFGENYRVVKDNSGSYADKEHPLTVSKNGQINLIDVPYGTYLIEEVSADSPGYVPESFVVSITQEGQQISTALHNIPKMNKIKVKKVNGETGKTVRLKGTAFRLRYMGRPDSVDPSTDQNFGSYLPNGANITDGKDYVFVCNENGEISLPYQLEYGNYQLEEIVVPEGYWLEKTKDEYVNTYDFKVTEQDAHLDGQDYATYYVTIAMKNQPVKGKIKVFKDGESLAGWRSAQDQGYSLWQSVWEKAKLPKVKFEVYAAEDIGQIDGVVPVKAFYEKNQEPVKLALISRDHSDKKEAKEIFQSTLPTGETITQTSDKDVSDKNKRITEYKTAEPRETIYKENYRVTRDGIQSTYQIRCKLQYLQGGMNYTDIHVEKEEKLVGEGEIKPSKPTLKSGDQILELNEIILPNGNRVKQNQPNLEEYVDEKTYRQEYNIQTIQHFDEPNGFSFTFDEFTLHAQVSGKSKAITDIKGFPDGVVEIENLGGYTVEEKDGYQFTSQPKEKAPIYFLTNDGIKTTMRMFGGLSLTTLNIKESQLFSFDGVYPKIQYNGKDIDWSKDLKPGNEHVEYIIDEKNYIKADRHQRSDLIAETFYTVELVSNQGPTMSGFKIIYPDTTECVPLVLDGGTGGKLKFTSVDHTMLYPIGSPVAVITTDDQGLAVTDKLPLGKYYIHESEGGAGHKSDGSWKKVNLSYKDQQTSLVWEEERIENAGIFVKINLRKLFETAYESKEYIPGSGAVFGVYTADEKRGQSIDSETSVQKSIPKDSLVGILKINGETSQISLKLPMGRYYVKEVVAPKGFQLDSTKYYFDAIDQLSPDKLQFHYEDWGIRGKIVQEAANQVVMDLETLYRYPKEEIEIKGATVVKDELDGRTVMKMRINKEATIEFEQRGILTIKPDEHGYTAAFDGIYPKIDLGRGEGLALDQTGSEKRVTYTAKVVKTNFCSIATWKKNESVKPVKLEFISPLKTSGAIVRIDGEKIVVQPTLKSESFALDKESNQTVSFDDGSELMVKTNAKGELTMVLRGSVEGDLKEESSFSIDDSTDLRWNGSLHNTTSKTYGRSDTGIGFVDIFIDNIKNSRLPSTPEIPSVPRKGKLELSKVDSVEGKPLAGAEFQILNEKKIVLYTKSTDEQGKIRIDNLEPGVYFYHEIKAPKGYRLDENYYQVTVKENLTAIAWVVNNKIKEPGENVNEPKPDKPEISKKPVKISIPFPQTGDNSEWWYLIVAVAGIACISIMTVKKKK